MGDFLVGLALTVGGVFCLVHWPLDLYDTALKVRAWNTLRVLMLAVGISLAWSSGAELLDSLGRQGGEASIPWRGDVEAALEDARSHNMPAILDAGAEWCAACKELEHRTFTDPRVVEALRRFVCIHVDMTDFDTAQAHLKALGIEVPSLPWVAFFLPDGRLNPGVTLTDFEPPDAFLTRVELATTWRDRAPTPVEAWISHYGLLLAMLLVFVAGIGVSLTPCVYPLIPITVSVVGGSRLDGQTQTGVQRLWRSLAFVFGLFVTYTTLGVLSAVLGKGFGSLIQHPAVSLGFAALLAALAASYLGFFRLDLPAGLKTRLGRRRGGVLGLALIGAGTGLLAAPCAGPVVVGILTIISATGDILTGTLLMASFAAGLGLLFFGIGLSTAFLSRLPRGGAWMTWVEVAFAVMLLVVAIHYGRLGATALWRG